MLVGLQPFIQAARLFEKLSIKGELSSMDCCMVNDIVEAARNHTGAHRLYEEDWEFRSQNWESQFEFVEQQQPLAK